MLNWSQIVRNGFYHLHLSLVFDLTETDVHVLYLMERLYIYNIYNFLCQPILTDLLAPVAFHALLDEHLFLLCQVCHASSIMLSILISNGTTIYTDGGKNGG